MRSQRVASQPTFGDTEADPPASFQANAWNGKRRARMVEQDREPESQQLGADLRILEHGLHLGKTAAASENKQREAGLLACGKARHVGVLKDIRSVLVKTDMRHRHPGFVQQGRPFQQPSLLAVRCGYRAAIE